MRRLVIYVLPILAYGGLIFFLSSQSALPAPKVQGLDKLAHFLEYAVLGLLVTRALFGYRVRVQRAVVFGTLLCVGFAISDEIHQMFTPHRSAELLDLVADTLGAIVGGVSWRMRELARLKRQGEL